MPSSPTTGNLAGNELAHLGRDLIEAAGQVPEVRERLEQERHAAAVGVTAAFQHQFQFAGRQQEMFD